MNVLEHKNRLSHLAQYRRLVKDDGKIEFPEFDWNSLRKPPITNYLPYQVISNIDMIVSDVKLMNKPQKKYQMVNELLKPYGFRHLASGTNRRAFYCTYDDSIILKIASDRIGKSDNISEFQLQNLIQPFCPKIYEVIPNGVMALSERVEPMTEYDYKKRWNGDVFDFIFQIFLRGYIMEDIGSNFFKNWGVRYGFGPVILDFPYIYQVDWSRLKCIKEDPETGTQCNGDLDYDYSNGMSQIICNKCGARYSAKYLSKKVPIYNFTACSMKGDKINMFSYFRKPQVAIVKNGKFIPVSMEEESMYFPQEKETRPAEKPTGNVVTVSMHNARTENTTNNKPVVKVVEGKTTKNKTTNKVPNYDNPGVAKTVVEEEIKIETYPKDLFNTLLFSLKKIEGKHGLETAKYIAAKLGIKYRTCNPNNKEASTTINSKCKLEPTVVNKEVTKEAKEETVKEEKKEEGDNKKWKDRSTDINSLDKSLTEYANNPTPTERFVVKKSVQESKDVSKSSVNQVKPTEGLYTVRAKTREEIEAEDNENRAKNEILGIPGTTPLNYLRYQEKAAQLRSDVYDKFNEFVLETTDKDGISVNLSMAIKEYIFDVVKDILPEEYTRLTVDVVPTFDNKNKPCYKVEAKCMSTFIFSLNLYPFDESGDTIDQFDLLINNKADLDKFLTSVCDSIDDSMFNDIDDMSKLRNFYIGTLYTKLMNTRSNNVQFGMDNPDAAKAIDLVSKWLDENYNFFNEEDNIEEVVENPEIKKETEADTDILAEL